MNERNLAVSLRPNSLSDFIGMEKILTQIRNQLDSGKIPTAYLFSGPSGCGKTSLARAINNTLEGDSVEINAADDTGVDYARQLGEDSQRRPLLGKYRVIILDECHQLTKAAQNALLKYVEDAPSSTIWIFCTTEPTKIIPTLRSRCLSFALSGFTRDQTSALVNRGLIHLGKEGMNYEDLVNTLVEEGITAPRTILMAVERFVGGMDPIGAALGSEISPTAIDIARATFKRDWKSAAALLSKVTPDEAMSIRITTAAYFKSCLLKAPQKGLTGAIFKFTDTIPFEPGLNLAQLCAIIYDICNPLSKGVL